MEINNFGHLVTTPSRQTKQRNGRSTRRSEDRFMEESIHSQRGGTKGSYVSQDETMYGPINRRCVTRILPFKSQVVGAGTHLQQSSIELRARLGLHAMTCKSTRLFLHSLVLVSESDTFVPPSPPTARATQVCIHLRSIFLGMPVSISFFRRTFSFFFRLVQSHPRFPRRPSTCIVRCWSRLFTSTHVS